MWRALPIRHTRLQPRAAATRRHKWGGRWAPGRPPGGGSAGLQHSLRERLRADCAHCRVQPREAGARAAGQGLRPARPALVRVVGGCCVCAGLWEAGRRSRSVRAGVHVHPSFGGLGVIEAGCGFCVLVETDAAGLQTLGSGHHHLGVWLGRGGESGEQSRLLRVWGKTGTCPEPRWEPRCVCAHPSRSGNPQALLGI